MSATREDEPRPPAERAARPLHLNWSGVAFEQVAEGVERQMIVGEKMMICRLRTRAGR